MNQLITHTHTHGHLGVNDKTTVCMFKEEKRIPTERNIRPARLSLMRRGPHSQESAAPKRRFVKIQVFPTGLLHVCMCVCGFTFPKSGTAVEPFVDIKKSQSVSQSVGIE